MGRKKALDDAKKRELSALLTGGMSRAKAARRPPAPAAGADPREPIAAPLSQKREPDASNRSP